MFPIRSNSGKAEARVKMHLVDHRYSSSSLRAKSSLWSHGTWPVGILMDWKIFHRGNGGRSSWPDPALGHCHTAGSGLGLSPTPHFQIRPASSPICASGTRPSCSPPPPWVNGSGLGCAPPHPPTLWLDWAPAAQAPSTKSSPLAWSSLQTDLASPILPGWTPLLYTNWIRDEQAFQRKSSLQQTMENYE